MWRWRAAAVLAVVLLVGILFGRFFSAARVESAGEAAWPPATRSRSLAQDQAAVNPASSVSVKPGSKTAATQRPDVAVALSVLNPQISRRERRQNLHRMTTDPARFRGALAAIAGSTLPPLSGEPAPHSVAEMELKFERGLRISALESLDRLASRDGTAVDLIRDVYQQQSEPSLNFLAGLSLAGIEQGRPGKLTRFIDKLIAQH